MFSKLKDVTKSLELRDTEQIFAQGVSAFRGMFTRAANPFKSDRDRAIWDKGYKHAEEAWFQTERRNRENERGQR